MSKIIKAYGFNIALGTLCFNTHEHGIAAPHRMSHDLPRECTCITDTDCSRVVVNSLAALFCQLFGQNDNSNYYFANSSKSDAIACEVFNVASHNTAINCFEYTTFLSSPISSQILPTV